MEKTHQTGRTTLFNSLNLVIIIATVFLLFYFKNEGEGFSRRLEKIEQKYDMYASEIMMTLAGGLVSGDHEKALDTIGSTYRGTGIIFAGWSDGGGEFKKGVFIDYDLERAGRNFKRGFKSEGDFFEYISGPGAGRVKGLRIITLKFEAKPGGGQAKGYGRLTIAFLERFSLMERTMIAGIHRHIVIVIPLLGAIANLLVLILGSPLRKRRGEVLPHLVSKPDVEELKPEEEAVQEEHIDGGMDKGPDVGLDIFTVDVEKPSMTETAAYPSPEAASEGWINIFNGYDINDWEKAGNWYVSNQILVGAPWQGSVVRNDLAFSNYEYRFKAKKLAGPDGFVAIFMCGGKCHAWVVGGWNNKKSQVLGVDSTVSPDTVERSRWYEVRISVTDRSVEACLDGRVVWSQERRVFEEATSQKEFLQGLGLGIYSTLCKFRDVQLMEK